MFPILTVQKMEIACSSQVSVNLYQCAECHIPKEFHRHHLEDCSSELVSFLKCFRDEI
jgi:hypothetical protein